MKNNRFYDLLPELQTNVWKFLFPVNDINNEFINHTSLGTSVNNIFLTDNYCYKCGDPNLVSSCRFCNLIIIMQCKKCKHVSIYNDLCCVDTYIDYLM